MESLLYFAVLTLVFDTLTASDNAYRYAEKHQIVVQRYEKTLHEASLKALFLANTGIGSRLYTLRLQALDFFNKNHDRLKLWVAYSPAHKVIGFSWIQNEIRKSISAPNFLIHTFYNKKHIARLITDAAHSVPPPASPTIRVLPVRPLTNTSSKGKLSPTLIQLIRYVTPGSTIAISYAIFSTLQTVYYQGRCTPREAKKLFFYVICGALVRIMHCTAKEPYKDKIYPYDIT